MQYARERYMNCLIDESDLPMVIEELEQYQDNLHEQNKRLRPAEIRITGGYQGVRRLLRIGEQHLVLVKVKDVIIYQTKAL